MCGIAGILSKTTVSKDKLCSMTDAIVHRGPDGADHWVSGNGLVGLGHRRLSIIDLSTAASQPMHDVTDRYVITFNGEIYNYLELREDLKKKGYNFSTSSDTEVLLASFAEKGEKCLNDLDGMFAFAIWDKREKRLFCARDRFGEKPFHYFFDNESFIFASEIKQFWSAGVEKRINMPMLDRYIKYGIVESNDSVNETYYKNIRKLDAGTYLWIDQNLKMSTGRYWSIHEQLQTFSGTIEEASMQFYNLMEESVRLRLRSDVPVGSSLSGGLDSSAIVLLIDKIKNDGLVQNTFSARFKNFVKDEGRFIEMVAARCRNLTVHYVWPDQDYFEQNYERVVFHQDEPFGSASVVAQYSVMEEAKKKKVTVLLDGQGADEQLAGYLPYYHLYLDQLKYSVPTRYKTELGAYNNFHGAAIPYSTTVHETTRMKLGRYKRKLTGKPGPYDNLLRQRLSNDMTVNGLKELLRYADRNSMAHSREVRLPFLSHKLVEFVMSLPDNFLLRDGWTKFILRQSMKQLLPQEICWRVDKIGYEPPQNRWIDSEKYRNKIQTAAKTFNLELKKNDSPKTVFTGEWRLLMAAEYIW